MEHTAAEFSKITDHIYLGTNMCCGVHGKKLAKMEFTADIDLEAERQELPPHVPAYLWLPVPDHAAPSQEQLDLGVAFIEMVMREGGRVYVHCRAGHGRSPTLVAAYFITQGLSADEAIHRVKAFRPSAHPEEPQVAALREFEWRLRPARR